MKLCKVFIPVALVASTTAYAHARWLTTGGLKARSTDTGLKVSPCGGKTAVEANRKAFTAGETVEVHWEETINHTGHFRIAFSPANDEGFDDHVLKADIPDDQNGSISGPSDYHQFSTTITIPSTNCESCTLQLIQFMAESGTNYYSCADIKITGGSDTTATVTGTGTGTGSGTGTATKPEAPKKLKVSVKKVGDL